MISLDSIVKEVIADDADTLHLYPDYLRYALRGVAELNYDTVKQIKSVLLPVNTNNTVDLPKDYVDYTKIGVINVIDGNINVLGLNESLNIIPVKNDCGDDILTTNFADTRTFRPDYATWRFYNFIYFGINRGTLFGYGGGYNLHGAYRLNLAAWQIQLSSDVTAKQIVLEYVNNGVDDEMNTLVHDYLKEPLIAYINWKKVLPKRSVSMGEKRENERLFYAERWKLVTRVKGFTLEEFKAAVRYNYHQGVKE